MPFDFATDIDRRFAAGICISSTNGVFFCPRKVDASIRAIGCGICAHCDAKEARREGAADGAAYARTVGA